MTEKNKKLVSDYEKAYKQLNVKSDMYITIIEHCKSSLQRSAHYSFEWLVTAEGDVKYTQVSDGDVIEVNKFEYFVEEDFPLEEKIQSLWKHMVINFNENWRTWQKSSYGQHKTLTENLFFFMPRKNIFEIKKGTANGLGTMKGLGEITDILLGLAVSPTDAKKEEYQSHVNLDCKSWQCNIPKDVIRELRNLNPGYMMHITECAKGESEVFYTYGSLPCEENDGVMAVSRVNKDGKVMVQIMFHGAPIEPAQLAECKHRSVFEVKCEDFLSKTPVEQNNMYWAIVLAFHLKPEKLDEWHVKRVEKTANRNWNFVY